MEQENYNKPATSSVMQFNRVGDFIKGTLMSVEVSPRPDAYGKKNTVYKIKTKEGSFHRTNKETKIVDEKPTAISEGQEYTMFLSGPPTDLMKQVLVGQKFKIELTGLKPSAKGQPAKIRTVYPGVNAKGEPLMDKEYLESLKANEEF